MFSAGVVRDAPALAESWTDTVPALMQPAVCGRNSCPYLTWATLGTFASRLFVLWLSLTACQEETRVTELKRGHAGGGGVRVHQV